MLEKGIKDGFHLPPGIHHRSCEFSLKRMEALDPPVKIM
jgi:hypothetical protein